MRTAILLAFLAATSGAGEARKPVKVIVSPEARLVLDKNGFTMQGGILRKRGEKKGSDMTFGDTLRCVVHPEAKGVLAVGIYNRGRRDSLIRIEFPGQFGPALIPENTPGPALAKLLPESWAAPKPKP